MMGRARPRLAGVGVGAFVLLALASTALAQVHVALILDASGSMYNRLADGRYRIDAAKAVLQGIVAGLPDDDRLHVGLRVYGARSFATDEGACEDSHLEVELVTPDVPETFEARFLHSLPEGGQRVVGRSTPFETAALRGEPLAPEGRTRAFAGVAPRHAVGRPRRAPVAPRAGLGPDVRMTLHLGA